MPQISVQMIKDEGIPEYNRRLKANTSRILGTDLAEIVYQELVDKLEELNGMSREELLDYKETQNES